MKILKKCVKSNIRRSLLEIGINEEENETVRHPVILEPDARQAYNQRCTFAEINRRTGGEHEIALRGRRRRRGLFAVGWFFFCLAGITVDRNCLEVVPVLILLCLLALVLF